MSLKVSDSDNPQIVEIAALAEVAVSTALRVLSGRSNVSVETTERVFEAHRQLTGGASQRYAISPSRQKRIIPPSQSASKQSDVARFAGVGAATVSRALRGDGLVSHEKLQRILRAARELNYVPDRGAQSLRGKGPGIVGVMIPSFEDSFMRYVEAIERVVRFRGSLLTLALSHHDENIIRNSFRDLVLREAEGLVLIHPEAIQPELLEEIKRSAVPVVWVSNVGSLYINSCSGFDQEASNRDQRKIAGADSRVRSPAEQEELDSPARAAALLTSALRSRSHQSAPKQSDVARLADVGAATVSRTLRGERGVSKEKVRRILEAARELNYVQ